MLIFFVEKRPLPAELVKTTGKTKSRPKKPYKKAKIALKRPAEMSQTTKQAKNEPWIFGRPRSASVRSWGGSSDGFGGPRWASVGSVFPRFQQIFGSFFRTLRFFLNPPKFWQFHLILPQFQTSKGSSCDLASILLILPGMCPLFGVFTRIP